MQVEGNLSATAIAPGGGVVSRGGTAGDGGNDAIAEQPVTTQQSNPSENSIITLMKQDGVVVNFSIDKETNDFVVKLINPFTNQVIKQIPPEQLVSLGNSIQQIAGLLVDKKA